MTGEIETYFVVQGRIKAGDLWSDMLDARRFLSQSEAQDWLKAKVGPLDKLFDPQPQYRIVERLDDVVAEFHDWQAVKAITD